MVQERQKVIKLTYLNDFTGTGRVSTLVFFILLQVSLLNAVKGLESFNNFLLPEADLESDLACLRFGISCS